jgi:hypothetical protein
MTRDSKTTSTPGIKDDFKEYDKNMRNENGIILSFRWISWHRSSLLRERSLKPGQLLSFPYVTWLSLPFQCFSFIVVFATNSCSFGTGIYVLSLCRNSNDLNYGSVESTVGSGFFSSDEFTFQTQMQQSPPDVLPTLLLSG